MEKSSKGKNGKLKNSRFKRNTTLLGTVLVNKKDKPYRPFLTLVTDEYSGKVIDFRVITHV